jgi:hypothetical protein
MILEPFPRIKAFFKNGVGGKFSKCHYSLPKVTTCRVDKIYHNDVAQEEVELDRIPTRFQLKQLFLNKGFQPKAPHEMVKVQSERKAQHEEEMRLQHERNRELTERNNKKHHRHRSRAASSSDDIEEERHPQQPSSIVAAAAAEGGEL